MRLLFIGLLILGATKVFSQTEDPSLPSFQEVFQPTGGTFTGNLEGNANFFVKDPTIGANNTPQYEHQLFGAESWLNMNYSNWGFDFTVRYDMFQNSNIPNPVASFNGQGIGRWFVGKRIDKLYISGGYLYDQIGSGVIFRAFEERPLNIDNALFGVKLDYDISSNWHAKAFTGKQKNQFGNYNSVIRGGNIDGFIHFGDSTAGWSIAPGAGVTVKTLDDETVSQIVNTISTYSRVDSIGANYNTFAYTAYNKLSAGPITWYIETAFKTKEVFFDPFVTKTNSNGSSSIGKLVRRPGSVLYTSLNYAKDWLGLTLETKRTENFTFRAAPFVQLNRGLINFLPPMTRMNTYRLTARYNAATQEIGEMAYQADVEIAANDHLTFAVNGSYIDDLNHNKLYRELYTEVAYKKDNWSVLGGIQRQEYNQNIYETKPGVPMVQTITPYVEYLHRFDKRRALRTEFQYMNTDQDYGGWFFALAEYSIGPEWIITVSDMYNYKPTADRDDSHYWTAQGVYNHNNIRYAFGYVRQVQGVVCTGGICRLEPTFNGVKFNINATF
jgi:hypothetical protein